jgi:hypothetical protein
MQASRPFMTSWTAGEGMNWKLLGLILITALLNAVSLGASADEMNSLLKRNNWVEVGFGTFTPIVIKSTFENRGWALAATDYDGIDLFNASYMTQDGRPIDQNISELALLRTFSKHVRWFYMDSAIGIGYMDATLAKNCEETKGGGWFSLNYICEQEKRKKGLSIPMEVDVAFGRYLGMGVKLRLSIGVESAGGFAFTFPLGGFAKK